MGFGLNIGHGGLVDLYTPIGRTPHVRWVEGMQPWARGVCFTPL